MDYYKLPELSPEEKKMPLAKYYTDYPLYCPPPLQQQLLDAGPMDPADALPVENFLDLLSPTGYRKVQFGYCMLPDGAAYYSEYTVIPNIPGDMKRWFMNFINHRSRSMVPGQGNLRYKLWCPVDHWDRAPVDGVDPKNGMYTIGALDQGETNPWDHIKEFVHRVDLSEFGMTEEREEALRAAGCRWSSGWEDFDGPGHHMWVHIDRPNPLGGIEMLGIEWLGYYPKNGKIIRDETTPVSEELAKKILIHNVIEHLHLPQILPDLYAEYKEQPIDAD